eukprot:CAMPEP_0114272400 /NCGR_PEP_ID=MMETSP0058-20121206/28451_1 /TAXON_ID=36894 /ORGANISM="Pyramimonas parkeae, CCMP726" /LENGTH=54 /DNA_ID=CAMNT_0001391601 /DNA_START=112 /DNA_END=273 /DNA_ORIENTATION=-
MSMNYVLFWNIGSDRMAAALYVACTMFIFCTLLDVAIEKTLNMCRKSVRGACVK